MTAAVRQQELELFQGDYLSLRALQGLATYKYKSGGLTWLDYAHTPLWNCALAA
jgi:hypothetical protein